MARLTELPEAERPKLVVFDLNNLNAKPMTLIPKFKTKLKKATSIVGFLNHLQGELKAKAIEAGCDTVMPRSAFSQTLPNLLRRYGVEEEEDYDAAAGVERYRCAEHRGRFHYGSALFVFAGNLSRGPGERASAEQVDVEMIHGLAAVLAGVDHHAVALGQALLAGDLGGGPQQVAEQRAVALIGIGQRGDVFARRHQHMHRRLRVNVREGVAELVLVDRRGGDASVNDLAKEATHSETSVQDERFVARSGSRQIPVIGQR